VREKIAVIILRLDEADRHDQAVMFIVFYEKENEPKEIAPATWPLGLPGASRIGRSRWNPLALRQPQRLFALFCDARRATKGKVNPPRDGQPL
jgi:hypothetical protein